MKIHDVAILKNEFAIILSKKPVYIRANPVMCAVCMYVVVVRLCGWEW